jgi:predicted RNA methylase
MAQTTTPNTPSILSIPPSTLPANFSRLLHTPSGALVEKLFNEYLYDQDKLDTVNGILSGSKYCSSINYLIRSSMSDNNAATMGSIAGSSISLATKLLHQTYWGKAIALTDVKHHMPMDRKVEWQDNLKKLNFPEFNLENVVFTLSTLLLDRDKFVAERVDGIFKKLSGDHVTNNPSGFYKRMIINNIHSGERHYYSICTSRCGYVNDLRVTIARFMERSTPDTEVRISTYETINRIIKANLFGEWHNVDGGALRFKVYKKGTIHIEVQPDIAWQLNQILALLYPMAIPSEFRSKPKKIPKEFVLSQNILDVAVLSEMQDVELATEVIGPEYRRTYKRKKDIYTPRYSHSIDKHVLKKVADVLRSIGGVELPHNEFQFDYDVKDVLDEICITGCVPDEVSHQFYETPDNIAQEMASMVGQLAGNKILEPSAGQGSIAQHLKGDITCVEVSALHCKILESKGFTNVINEDFLEWGVSQSIHNKFDAVVMNPPFSQGRALYHFKTALQFLEKGGVLVGLATHYTVQRLRKDHNVTSYRELEGKEFGGVSVELAIFKITA